MRTSTLILSCLLTVSASASSWLNTGAQKPFDEDLKVPGENPLYYCSDPADNILTIDKVDLDPNPPKPGESLSITAEGTLNEEVEEGAKVHLQVKYGLITLINQEAQLCDYVKNVELKCPLKKGDMTLSKSVDLPKEIPPGKYKVLADAFTKDGERITCLEAQIEFHRGNKGEAVEL